jgi:pimeloyl-ACP methyl ester carboxylesterase
MQTILMRVIQILFGTLEAVVPRLSNTLALWFFFRPVRVPRPGREEPVLRKAKRSRRPLGGFYERSDASKYYEAYEWGEGPTVLLVHGWGGRGTQFHQMIDSLVERGYKVVAFDAPAHGDSPGVRTNLLEFGEIIRDLGGEYGEFQGVIAHSFGAVASIRALVLDQLPAQNLTVIGAPANIEFILQGFSKQVHITERSLGSIKDTLNQIASNDLDEFSLVTHLPALEQPLMIVHDAEDRSVDFQQGRAIAAMRPDAKWVATAGLGHNRILSDAAVIEGVLGFLESEVNIPVT